MRPTFPGPPSNWNFSCNSVFRAATPTDYRSGRDRTQGVHLPRAVLIKSRSLMNHMIEFNLTAGEFQSAGTSHSALSSQNLCLWVKPIRSEEHTSELQSPCNLVC